MPVAIGFFGITRSLKYTIESIKKNVFDVLKREGVDYDVFIHTYFLQDYNNPRIEKNVKNEDIDNEEYKLLNTDYLEIDNQCDVKKKLNLKSYRTHRDPWNSKYATVDNFLLGQYSKLKLTHMIERSGIDYDYVIFMRPDCLYLNELSIEYFNRVNDSTVCVPDFHLYGSLRFNDRFCVSNSATYKIYGKIFEHLLDISHEDRLHSETVIAKHLKKCGVGFVKIPFKFLRIRFGGKCNENIGEIIGNKINLKPIDLFPLHSSPRCTNLATLS